MAGSPEIRQFSRQRAGSGFLSCLRDIVNKFNIIADGSGLKLASMPSQEDAPLAAPEGSHGTLRWRLSNGLADDFWLKYSSWPKRLEIARLTGSFERLAGSFGM